MKNILPIIILFVVTLIGSAGVIVLLVMTKPELFGRGGPSPSEIARADSLKTAETMTMLRGWHPSYFELAGVDTTKKVVAAARDTAKPPAPIVKSDTTTGPAAGPNTALAEKAKPTSADSLRAKERKSMAKVIESMQAESAAKILKDLSDPEVKEIILTIKKRQAAKILGALDPDRAARIMR